MGIPPQTPPPYPPSRAQWKAQQAQWKMQSKMQRAAYRAQVRGYTRYSMVGPLLLVGIGVVALLITTHRINASYFWQWYGRWWPLILIGAGVVLALESMAVSRHSRVRLGGGVVLLGVLLAFLGLSAAHHANWKAVGDQLDLGNDVDLSQLFGTKHEASEQVLHSLPADATVVIQNPHGDVTVSSTSAIANDDQMRLTLRKTIYGNSDSQAQQRMQAMEPLITTDGNIVVVHMPSSDSENADMEIALPANAALQIRAGHGDIKVNGRQANVDVSTDHGDMQLTAITGALHAVMHQGDFSANNIHGDLSLSGRMDDVTLSQIAGTSSLNGDFFGDVHLENLHGFLRLHSSRTDFQLVQLAGSVALDGDDLTISNATGPIAVNTRAKDVSLRHVTGDVRVRNSDGSIQVVGADPIGTMNIDNQNGSVDVTLPAGANFSVQAAAMDGEVHSDFNLSKQNNGRRSTISGNVGNGGPAIRINAEKGDITLHKSE